MVEVMVKFFLTRFCFKGLNRMQPNAISFFMVNAIHLFRRLHSIITLYGEKNCLRLRMTVIAYTELHLVQMAIVLQQPKETEFASGAASFF